MVRLSELFLCPLFGNKPEFSIGGKRITGVSRGKQDLPFCQLGPTLVTYGAQLLSATYRQGLSCKQFSIQSAEVGIIETPFPFGQCRKY